MKRALDAEPPSPKETGRLLFVFRDEFDAPMLSGRGDRRRWHCGYPLEWQELPTRRDCRISAYLNEVDPEDETDWRRQHEWLASRLNDMHRVFAGRVRALDADAWLVDGRPDAADTTTSGRDFNG